MSSEDSDAMTAQSGENAIASDDTQMVDMRRRRLLKNLGKSAYAAPVALAMMTMSANASSMTC